MSDTRKKIATVVGARPQFVKSAVVSREFQKRPALRELLIHTGQHYDANMSEVFFRQLEIREPDYNLEVGSHKASRQYATIMERLLPVLEAEKPDVMLVYGDTNSTFAASLTAATLDIPVVHVEAGERMFQRKDMPEEINRILTDCLATLNLTCTERARRNLVTEGQARRRVIMVGDPMYDLFLITRSIVESAVDRLSSELGVEENKFCLATLHRPQNTDDSNVLRTILDALDGADIPVVLPAHPRVARRIQEMNWHAERRLILIDPIGNRELIDLLLHCAVCFTDSGGVTREAFFAGKPCVVPVLSDWWPDIVESGWAVKIRPTRDAIHKYLHSFRPTGNVPVDLFGDGNSGVRIANEVERLLLGDIDTSPWRYDE